MIESILRLIQGLFAQPQQEMLPIPIRVEEKRQFPTRR
ncbi:hypothetical protein ROLI_024730 [Roseobacter fucihabitans]|uniref:Uncharacterized protein n=1 Tax=Roseobacter fucihabitans TaxID=1537242 RepID=A0ABZ2BTK7_9RHOB|nr:hypothetical protein [Roseobacter litoralis]